MPIKEILKYCETTNLHQFIIDYAAKDREFKNALISRLDPKKISEDKEDYAAAILMAFNDNAMKGGNRYSGWEEYGFDAMDVAADLQPLLEKVDYCLLNKNYDEAVIICQALIETIPDEWEPEFDEDGDVQVVYDDAIEKLRKILENNFLTSVQKEALFDWYTGEHTKSKHEYVGLDTNLKVLEVFFSDTPEMLAKNLANMEERIKNSASDYEKEKAAISKIELLQNAGLEAEAESAISQYIRFKDVRKLRLEKLIKGKQYADAIQLIAEGIQVALNEQHPGTVTNWKEDLLNIYELQKDPAKILATAEELFYDSHNHRKYYDQLKKYTPESEWPVTLERLLSKMNSGFFGFNSLKAEILIEHKMWERLFAICQKAGAEKLEEYEKYLTPYYAKEIFDSFYKYVETQALITDQNAYMNVARVLKKMKQYEGGEK
jgi:hypothetical protein